MWTGLAGMLGGVAGVCADYLYVLTSQGATDLIAVMSQVPLWRISLSAALGIVGSWLCTLGAWQVYLALRPAGQWLSAITFGAFAAMTIAMGGYHVAFAGFAFVGRTARLAGADTVTTERALSLFQGHLGALQQVLYPPTTVLALLFIGQVALRRTGYPRWFLVFTPSLAFFAYPVFQPWARATLPDFAYVLISSAYYNGVMLLFYAASTLVLLTSAAGRNVTATPRRPSAA